jgi:hypothetical protein
MSESWTETEVLKRPLFGRYRVESRHNSDIAKVKRLTDAVEKGFLVLRTKKSV